MDIHARTDRVEREPVAPDSLARKVAKYTGSAHDLTVRLGNDLALLAAQQIGDFFSSRIQMLAHPMKTVGAHFGRCTRPFLAGLGADIRGDVKQIAIGGRHLCNDIGRLRWHISGALKHQFFDRQDELERMGILLKKRRRPVDDC